MIGVVPAQTQELYQHQLGELSERVEAGRLQLEQQAKQA